MIERARIKTTDHLGRIELFDYSAGSVLDLNSGSYSIEIIADGYLPYPDQPSLPDSILIPRNLSYTYELREDLQNFQFSVIDSLSRETLSNARISLDDYEYEYLVDELSYPEQNSIELAAMNYWIRVEADGYDPKKELYTKQPGRSVRIEIEMVQKTYELHSIVRDSQSNDIISNARIRAKTNLDGDYQRLDRPYRFHPGEHHLQISAPGYRSKTDKINIHEDMEKHYSLDRKRYDISFKTNIPARVFRDNQEVNPNTDDYNDNLSPGTYIYRFAAEGYAVAEKRIEVTQEKINSQGSAEIVPVNLQKKTGVLKVNLLDTFNRQSVIGDIAVGENVRKGVTEAEFTLPWGEYRVSASAPGRESTGQIITVIADETSSKSIFLSKSVISSGREVDLKTTPQWQELIIGIPYKGNRRDFRIEYVNREGQHKHKVENLNDNVPSKRLGDILSPVEVKPQSVIKIMLYGG
ncbi:MAG: hypothetical protein LHW43_04035 [Candidatus Cloacimonetes bacterium]|nr:hypothetical protein [Candidatus Cloacimonadota bacterium]